MNIDKNTKASEIMSKYPWLLDELVKVSDKFQFAKTPIGSMMLKNATIADISKKVGINENDLISKLTDFIKSHNGK